MSITVGGDGIIQSILKRSSLAGSACHANSREDAIKRARDGDGDYVGATTYDHTIQTISEHKVEEL